MTSVPSVRVDDTAVYTTYSREYTPPTLRIHATYPANGDGNNVHSAFPSRWALVV